MIAAVAQTFVRALVSVPVICPEAYITAASTVISIAATGSIDVSPEQRPPIATVRSLTPLTAKRRGNARKMIKISFMPFMAGTTEARLLIKTDIQLLRGKANAEAYIAKPARFFYHLSMQK